MEEVENLKELDEYLSKSGLSYRYKISRSLGIKLYTKDISNFLIYLGEPLMVLGLDEEKHIYIPRNYITFFKRLSYHLFMKAIQDREKIREGILDVEYDDIESWAERKNKELNQ